MRSLKVSPEKLDVIKEALFKFSSKADLAVQLQISPTTVSNFFKGEPIQKSQFQAICKKLKLNSQEISDLSKDSEFSQQISEPIPQNIPWSAAKEFVGRAETLQQLHELLQAYDQVTISGINGLGKTELAIQYAQKYFNNYSNGVIWLFAKAGDIGLQILEFVKKHFDDFKIPDAMNLEEQVQYCWKNWLISHQSSNTLIVLDDVIGYEQIKNYLPNLSQFKVLITTQPQELLLPQPRLDLDLLTSETAQKILESRIGTYRVKNTKGKGFLVNSSASTVIEKLGKYLEYLPLSIDLVGCYLEQQPDLSLEKMLSKLQKQEFTHQSSSSSQNTSIDNSNTEIGVRVIFELSWKKLDQYAQELACLLSIFASVPIPWAQVESVLGQIYLPGALLGKLLDGTQEDSENEIENLIDVLQESWEKSRHTLVKLHLLQQINQETYQLHQIIRDFLKEKLESLEKPNDLKEAFSQVMVAVAKQIPEQETSEFNEGITAAIPHLTEMATTWQDFLSDEDLSLLLIGLAKFYQSQGLESQAAYWHERSLSLA